MKIVFVLLLIVLLGSCEGDDITNVYPAPDSTMVVRCKIKHHTLVCDTLWLVKGDADDVSGNQLRRPWR